VHGGADYVIGFANPNHRHIGYIGLDGQVLPCFSCTDSQGTIVVSNAVISLGIFFHQSEYDPGPLPRRILAFGIFLL